MEYCFFVVSCKKNVQVLNVFLESLIQYKGSAAQIYISTDGDMVLAPHGGQYQLIVDRENKGFGNRICAALAQIPYKYIIVMCDDFVVEEPVDTDMLDSLVNSCQKDKMISSIALARTSGKNTNEWLLRDYVKKARFANYKATLQCSLWNKNAFSYLMQGVKSPWEFEMFANQRTFPSHNTFYAVRDDSYQPIKYNRGMLIIRGKVVIPEKVRLEKKCKRALVLDDYETTDSYIQPSNLSVWGRICRRIRLFFGKVKYILISFFKDVELNTQ